MLNLNLIFYGIACAISIMMPALFLGALGTFALSLYDIVAGKLSAEISFIRDASLPIFIDFADPLYVMLGALGIMFALLAYSFSAGD